jgi:peptidoglycan/xylan/chitin deacetylase (PgdA/CDA1 family)
MRDVIPVLLYHSVNDHAKPRDRPYSVSRACFAAHADAVRASGRMAIRMSELAAGLRSERPLPERCVAVTFDDGFADTYDAVQALLGRDISSTVYVTTGAVDTRDRLSCGGVAELARCPSVEVGAHGVRHRYLDELDDHELTEEVRGSKTQLEDMTQVPVNSFAYPHGAYDSRAREAVVRARYSSAAAVKNAVSHAGDDPFAIARWTVTHGTPACRIAQVLEGEGLPRAWMGERLRTRAFRTARRQRRRMTTRLDHGGAT